MTTFFKKSHISLGLSTPLFTTPTTSTTVTSDVPPVSPITTPIFKKLKPIKGRKPTPGKMTPNKRRLSRKLQNQIKLRKRYQQAARRLKGKKPKISKSELLEAIQDYLPERVSDFFAMQINHCNQTTKPYTDKEKQQALSYRYRSPALYTQLRYEQFALPSTSTIARWLGEIQLQPGICGDLMNFLRNKVHCMLEMERATVLMFDEMTMKHGLEYDSRRDLVEGLVDLGEEGRRPIPGSKVLLFMARGLYHKWKMPVAYYVVDKNVTAKVEGKLLINCISALQKTGLDIRAVVCDQSSTNRKAMKQLEVTKESPHFSVAGRKIFLIYDFPHIVKCIRNNLIKAPIVFDEGTAKWSHISKLYDLDKSSVKARSTKLTDKHLNPNCFEKMSVKLATQVMSHSVSSAMTTAVQTKQLPPEAQETATFLKRFNDIFDCMNSKSKFHPNPHKCALSKFENPHFKVVIQTLEQGSEWAKSLSRPNVDTKKLPPSFDGFEHSLRATLMIWEEVKVNDEVSYLMTSRLNQDPLENEFSISRQKCGYDRNPTAKRFRQNMRHRLQSALLRPSAGKNCESDEDEILEQQAGTIALQPSTCAFPAGDMENEQVSVPDVESDSDDDPQDELLSVSIPNLDTLEDNAVRYFAGYAVHATIKRFKCPICADELPKKNEEDIIDLPSHSSADSILIENRSYKTGTLTNPTDETCLITHIVLSVFNAIFEKHIQEIGIVRKMKFKSKQRIFKSNAAWMKVGTSCEKHRNFLLDRIIIPKIKRRLQEISKEARQPGGISKSPFWRKIKNLEHV